MSEQLQLTIYINEADRHEDGPLHEYLVRRMLRLHIAGATVLRGAMGFGKHGRLHEKRLFGVSDDRPVVIIAVDDEQRIRDIVGEIRRLVPDGLVTLHRVDLIKSEIP